MSTKEYVLKRLIKAEGQPVSGQELADTLSLSRAAIWKAIAELKEEGYAIESVRKRGYQLLGTPEQLNQAAIQQRLSTSAYGQHVHLVQSCSSTQTLAKQLVDEGAMDGTIVVTEHQTNGKGRLNRAWESNNNAGIWMSMITRPSILLHQAPQITLVAAVAIVQAVRELTEVELTIKWPNDLLIEGKKVTGILTELIADPDQVKAIIVGMGINVNQTEQDFSKEVRTIATSLAIATGERFNRNHLIAEIANQFEKYMHIYESIGFGPIKTLWEASSHTMGKQITARLVNETLQGEAIGIDDEGLLLLKLADGSIRRLYSADILL